MYLNATDVQCRPYWYGIPQYHNGEYEFGCIDCGGECPTLSPISTPSTFLPSTQPTFLSSTQPSFLPSTTPTWMPSASHAKMISFHPTEAPTEMAICKIGSCGGACCVSLIVIFGICVSGMIAFLIKKYIRRPVRNIGRVRNIEIQGIAMAQRISEEERRLPASDSLRVVIPSSQS